jgi:hypothetical protein
MAERAMIERIRHLEASPNNPRRLLGFPPQLHTGSANDSNSMLERAFRDDDAEALRVAVALLAALIAFPWYAPLPIS